MPTYTLYPDSLSANTGLEASSAATTAAALLAALNDNSDATYVTQDRNGGTTHSASVTFQDLPALAGNEVIANAHIVLRAGRVNAVTTTQTASLSVTGTGTGASFTGSVSSVPPSNAVVATTDYASAADSTLAVDSVNAAVGSFSMTGPVASFGNTRVYGISIVVNTTLQVPTIITAPTVSGTKTEGSVLTSTTGTWNFSPTSYAYQWQRDDVAISGATASTYTLVHADIGHNIRCVVTASNSAGASTGSASAETAIPIPNNMRMTI